MSKSLAKIFTENYIKDSEKNDIRPTDIEEGRTTDFVESIESHDIARMDKSKYGKTSWIFKDGSKVTIWEPIIESLY